jgi:hypothetical protein
MEKEHDGKRPSIQRPRETCLAVKSISGGSCLSFTQSSSSHVQTKSSKGAHYCHETSRQRLECRLNLKRAPNWAGQSTGVLRRSTTSRTAATPPSESSYFKLPVRERHDDCACRPHLGTLLASSIQNKFGTALPSQCNSGPKSSCNQNRSFDVLRSPEKRACPEYIEGLPSGSNAWCRPSTSARGLLLLCRSGVSTLCPCDLLFFCRQWFLETAARESAQSS